MYVTMQGASLESSVQSPIVPVIPAIGPRADTGLNQDPAPGKQKDSHWHALPPDRGIFPRTNHQAVIEQAVLAQAQLTDLVRQHYTSNNGRTR